MVVKQCWEHKWKLACRLVPCAKWDSIDMRFLGKGYLYKRGIQKPMFKNNLPGRDWAYLFLWRYMAESVQRMCQNIKQSHACVSRQIINEYFELDKSLEEVPERNILNLKKQIYRMTQEERKS